MKLAKYWTRQPGEAIGPDGRIRVVARGWSNESIEGARRTAQEVARRVAERIAAQPGRKQQYEYGGRPLPEPVLHEFRNGGPDPAAVVTRNMYGALVLNARDLMIVDIDREDRGVTGAIQGVAARHNLAGRTYRTAAGFRVLITSKPFQATSAASEALLREFQSDPLYVRLCRLQESFRARLTPKPWRCDMRTPPVDFPYETPRDEQCFREWEREYAANTAPYATCRFVGSFGGERVDPALVELVRFHDGETKAAADMPLA